MSEIVIPGEPIIQLTENGLEGFEVLCRLCANRSDHLISIYSEEGVSNGLAEKMNLYLPVKVAKSDTLPLQCCYQCASTVLTWHELIVASVETDRRLRSIQDEVDKQLAVHHAEPGPSQELEKPDIERCAVHLLTDAGHPVARGKSVDTRSFTTFMSNIKNTRRSDSEISIDTQGPAVEGSIDRKRAMVEGSIDTKRAMLESGIDRKRAMVENSIDRKPATVKSGIDTKHATVETSIDTKRTTVETNIDNPTAKTTLLDNKNPINTKPGLKQQKKLGKTTKTNENNDGNLENTQISAELPAELVQDDPQPALAVRKTFQCDLCDRHFVQKVSLERHTRIHRNERPYTCDVCGKGFRDKSGLSRHIDHVHGRLKKFPCDLCACAFASAATRDDHRRRHTKERPYMCQTCGKSFGCSATLYIHAKIHTDVFPFECSVCRKRFRRRQELVAHASMHSGARPYACADCDKSFRRKDYLTLHRLVHTDEKPFECEECGIRYRQARYLRNHMRTKHCSKE